jgi:hypothetical protein
MACATLGDSPALGTGRRRRVARRGATGPRVGPRLLEDRESHRPKNLKCIENRSPGVGH